MNNHGQPLTGSSIRSFLREYRIAAGIKKKVSPHTFRRTCASHLLQQGADLPYIQKLLGHAHMRTTQFYTKVTPVDIKETHAKTHPRLKDTDDED